MIITDFKNYLDEVEKINKRKEQLIEDMKNGLKESVENELSKYLDFIEYKNTKIFLVDDDYGIHVSNPGYNQYSNSVNINFVTGYKEEISGQWVSNYKINHDTYSTYKKEPIDIFVKTYVDKVKKYNIKRSLDKNKRKLRKDLKKYNL